MRIKTPTYVRWPGILFRTLCFTVIFFGVVSALSDRGSAVIWAKSSCVDDALTDPPEEPPATEPLPEVCFTPARGPHCERLRWGWGDCPGSPGKACDWCYDPRTGNIVAYVPRTHRTYKLSSQCEDLSGPGTMYVASDPNTITLMEAAGGTCAADPRLRLKPGMVVCQNVDANQYKTLLASRSRSSLQAKAPSKASEPRSRHNDLNSMRPSSPSAQKPPAIFPGLEKIGYHIYPINKLKVINAYGPTAPDAPLSKQKVGQGGYDVVTNGSFTANYTIPAVSVMRDGRVDTLGYAKTWNRGGVAVLRDGTIVVARQQGGSLDNIQCAFGTDQNPVVDFMGGGGLLIENGVKVTSEDLGSQQHFDQGGYGLSAGQFRSTFHTLVGIRTGQAFLITSPVRSGAQIQQDLLREGFGSAVKFDGGAGFYVRDVYGYKNEKGKNPLGLGIHNKRQ